MPSIITLCNQALAEIAKGEIGDLDEGSLEARACSRFAPGLLEEMVEWSDCLPFAKKRVMLAGITNDRPAEWLYAYAPPDDMATPMAIREQEDEATYLPIYGPGTFPHQDAYPAAFAFDGGVIYTNVENATLIYSRDTLEAGDLPPLGQRAFVLALAARIAMPLTKDVKIGAAVEQRAEIARARFIADEENKAPRQDVRYVSEAEWARLGYNV